MRLNKKQRRQLLKENCGAINDDDAVDPRHYFFNKRKPKNKFRKVFQLCRQVSETLQFVLADGDPALDGLSVVDVVPAPDARRLLVIVGIAPDRGIRTASDVDAVLECLRSHIPRLRTEISRTINRRKTPQLVFEIAKLNSNNNVNSN